MAHDFQDGLLGDLSNLFGLVADAATNTEARQNLFAQIGWEVDSESGFPGDALVTLLGDVSTAFNSLETLLANGIPSNLSQLTAALQAVSDVATAVQALGSVSGAPQEFAQASAQLLNSLLVTMLRGRHPVVFFLAKLLTIIEAEPVDPVLVPSGSGSSTVQRAPVEFDQFVFQRVIDLLKDPVGTLKQQYQLTQGLTDAAATSDLLFPRIAEFLAMLNVQTIYGVNPALGTDFGTFGNEIAAHALTIFFPVDVDPGENFGFGVSAALNESLGVVLVPFGTFSLSQVASRWQIDATVQGDAPGVAVSPSGVVFPDGTTSSTSSLGLTLTATKLPDITEIDSPDGASFQIGGTTGTRLEIGKFSVSVNAGFSSSSKTFGFQVATGQSALVLAGGDGDGLMSQILPANSRVEFNITVGWSNTGGLAFSGAGGLEVALPGQLTIGGVITLDHIKLRIAASSAGIDLAVLASVGATLGPLQLAVSDVGVGALMTAPDGGGNIGPLNAAVKFRLPTGLGVAINGGPVSGGGFISFDPDAGRYSGALALQVYSVAVKAFGVIDTKLPAGGPAFSFFIIISAEFQPIQLGFGFTLLGVGGLLGINRGLDQSALVAAVKAGSIDNILFPKNPIKDAPTILADVEAIFPPTNGTYAFGPLARIGWGTPAIIDARIGIVLIFPGTKIALLGVVTALLPPGASKALALVEIHMDVDGLLDFPKKHFEMDAELHDSQVRGFPISGDMAARMDWGSNPNFAVSLGGFNPHYTPPTGFPTLRRLTIDLGIKGNPSATLQGYMALTSNTAQVGAALSVTAHAGGANLSGGLAFDALFVFSPFSFDASLSGGVHVDFHGVGFGMHFDGEISGPAPWHLHGDVSVSVLWFSASVGFDLTLGGESKPQLPAIDIWAGSTPDANGNQDVPGLQSAVVAPGNWTGVLPPGGYQVVSITQNDSTASRVDPLGKATFQQKVAPFALAISKFAGRNRAKSDVTTVKVQTLSVNSTAVPAKQITAVPDFFAPVQYQNVPDAQALSSPSYQQLQGGFSFSSDDIVFGTELTQAIVMETILVGSSATPQTYSIPDDATMQAMTARSATGTGGLRKTNIDRFVDLTVTTLPFALATEAYALVLKTTLARFSGVASTDSAYALQSDQLAALTPNVRATLQIVPAHEIPG